MLAYYEGMLSLTIVKRETKEEVWPMKRRVNLAIGYACSVYLNLANVLHLTTNNTL